MCFWSFDIFFFVSKFIFRKQIMGDGKIIKIYRKPINFKKKKKKYPKNTDENGVIQV